MKFAPYSFSKLSAFVDCPIKFKFTYVDKVEVERPKYFKHGSCVHNSIDKYNTPKFTDDMNESLQPFFKTTLGQKYKPVLDNPEHFSCHKEVKFAVDENLQKTSYYSKDAMYRGAIDCIYVDEDGTLHLVDWKTGNVPEHSKWEQLETYSLLFLKKFKKVQLSFVYVERDFERTKTVTDNDYDRIKDELLKRISAVESANTYNKNETRLCQFCMYRGVCMSMSRSDDIL